MNKGATFRVKPGAHVIFGSNEVVINGHFDAQGSSAEERLRIVFTPAIDTYVGGNNTNCTFDPRAHQYIKSRTRMKVVGVASMPDAMESSVKATHCDFKNVSLEIKNMRTEPLLYNRFTAHSTSPPDMPGSIWSIQPYMLHYESSNWVSGLPPEFYRLHVAHCSFMDSAGVVAPRSPMQDDYLLKGIYCAHGLSVEASNNTFDYLATGSGVFGTPANQATPNLVKDNTFRECDAGMHIGQGDFQVCANTTNRVRIPINGYNLGVSRYYDNTFSLSREVVYFLNSQTQAFRNNNFIDYWTGINSNGTTVSLTSLYEADTASPIQAYGRNRFSVVDPAPFQPNGIGHPNPFTLTANWPQEVALLADLQYNAGAVYLIKCGYNGFSQFATSHLSAPWLPLVNVDGSYNDFRPNGMPRLLNVVVGGNPWNVQQGYNEFCGIQNDPQSCTSFNLSGGPVQGLGKRGLEESEAGSSRPLVPVRIGTFVFDQSVASHDGMLRFFSESCGGSLDEGVFQLFGVTGYTQQCLGLLQLHTNLQSIVPGVYSIRIATSNTGVCSVLMLVIP